MQVISNESMKFDDPKVFDDSQVFDDPKEIAIGSMDFHKVYGLRYFHLRWSSFVGQ